MGPTGQFPSIESPPCQRARFIPTCPTSLGDNRGLAVTYGAHHSNQIKILGKTLNTNAPAQQLLQKLDYFWNISHQNSAIVDNFVLCYTKFLWKTAGQLRATLHFPWLSFHHIARTVLKLFSCKTPSPPDLYSRRPNRSGRRMVSSIHFTQIT